VDSVENLDSHSKLLIYKKLKYFGGKEHGS